MLLTFTQGYTSETDKQWLKERAEHITGACGSETLFVAKTSHFFQEHNYLDHLPFARVFQLRTYSSTFAGVTTSTPESITAVTGGRPALISERRRTD